MKYECVCGYVYDPALGDPDNGIAPGTAWEDVPEDWVCPTCGLGKDAFSPAEYRKNLFKGKRSKIRFPSFFAKRSGTRVPLLFQGHFFSLVIEILFIRERKCKCQGVGISAAAGICVAAVSIEITIHRPAIRIGMSCIIRQSLVQYV